MKKIIRTERGWAGHFIGAQECGFRRNTLLQFGNTFIVVSTVGCYRPFKKVEEIGFDRFYETMAFHSGPSDDVYHDADVTQQVYAEDVEWAISKKDMDKRQDADNLADEMHEAYVKKVEEMLLNNEL